ncbi:MAG TPA: hypothetical protein VF134_09455 [Candidatus Dormibacteraeota bacterium]
MAIRVVFEQGKRLVFASALDWPGWSRSGKTEEQALELLAAYADRYAVIVRTAGLEPPDPSAGFDVVEHQAGDSSTDFGMPAVVAEAERKALSPKEDARRQKLFEACWKVFDHVVAGAPAELRKGPRGGGRDRDKIIDHVRGAQPMYERQLERGKWPKAYYFRRAAWHVTDHLWEVEDRSTPA